MCVGSVPVGGMPVGGMPVKCMSRGLGCGKSKGWWGDSLHRGPPAARIRLRGGLWPWLQRGREGPTTALIVRHG